MLPLACPTPPGRRGACSRLAKPVRPRSLTPCRPESSAAIAGSRHRRLTAAVLPRHTWPCASDRHLPGAAVVRTYCQTGMPAPVIRFGAPHHRTRAPRLLPPAMGRACQYPGGQSGAACRSFTAVAVPQTSPGVSAPEHSRRVRGRLSVHSRCGTAGREAGAPKPTMSAIIRPQNAKLAEALHTDQPTTGPPQVSDASIASNRLVAGTLEANGTPASRRCKLTHTRLRTGPQPQRSARRLRSIRLAIREDPIVLRPPSDGPNASDLAVGVNPPVKSRSPTMRDFPQKGLERSPATSNVGPQAPSAVPSWCSSRMRP